MTRKVENKISFNIPYQFIKKYKNNMKPVYEKGWINIVEPRRAIAIMGKPGSGKSYSFNEEILRQSIQKGFAIANYDFKFPTLTNVAHNYMQNFKENYRKIHSKEVKFVVINIDDPQIFSSPKSHKSKINQAGERSGGCRLYFVLQY